MKMKNTKILFKIVNLDVDETEKAMPSSKDAAKGKKKWQILLNWVA